MPDQNAAERFYEHPELVSLTLRHLNRSELVRLSPTLLSRTAAIIYCRVNYARYMSTLNLSTRWKHTYLNAIRIIDAHEVDSDQDVAVLNSQSARIFSELAIAQLRKHCPNVTSIHRTEGWHRHERWIIHPTGNDTGRLYRVVRRSLPSNTSFSTYPELEAPQKWSGWQLSYAIELHLDHDTFAKGEVDASRQVPIREWLMDFDNLDSAICRIYSHGPSSMDLTNLGALCASRAPRSKRNIEAIYWWQLRPYTISELSTFGTLATGLKELTLLNHLRLTAKLTVMDLADIVKVIKRDMPHLERLSIGLNGTWDGKWDYIFDEDVPISDLPWDGTLRDVEVVMQDDAFEERPGNIPVFAIARNVAALGGPACQYALHVDESGQTRPAFADETQLERIVGWFKALPPKRLAKMRHAQLMPLDVVQPHVKSLEALAFTIDDDPVPPRVYKDVVSLRKDINASVQFGRHAMQDVERQSKVSIERAHSVIADIMHKVRLNSLVTQQQMQELVRRGEASERAALGGSLLAPEFYVDDHVDRTEWTFKELDEDTKTELEEWREYLRLKSLRSEVEELEMKRDKLLEEVTDAEVKRASMAAIGT